MKFYSGFSLKNESYFFKPYINNSEYTVCGFSYGAIKAYEMVKEMLASKKRVDTLQLFSPAFFQNKSEKFKRLQMLAYSKNKEEYLKQFMDSCFSPYGKKEVEHVETSPAELDELLNYVWEADELKALSDKGIKIEVYLGSDDKIIDASAAREFFVDVSTVTYIKDANHFLQTK